MIILALRSGFRFGKHLGLSVVELSGDREPSASELDAADIICTTPEKFGEAAELNSCLVYVLLCSTINCTAGSCPSLTHLSMQCCCSHCIAVAASVLAQQTQQATEFWLALPTRTNADAITRKYKDFGTASFFGEVGTDNGARIADTSAGSAAVSCEALALCWHPVALLACGILCCNAR